MIHQERLKVLKGGAYGNSSFVLYKMQRAQRIAYNHALEFAVRQANEQHVGLIVYLDFDECLATLADRHRLFALSQLSYLIENLEQRGIGVVLKFAKLESCAFSDLAPKASLLVVEKDYLHGQHGLNKMLDSFPCPVIEVDSEVIVPIHTATNKLEYAAYTLRPKLNRILDCFLQPLAQHDLKVKTASQLSGDVFTQKLTASISDLRQSSDGAMTEQFYPGGELQANAKLETFIDKKLSYYDSLRNDPTKDFQSHLSPYLRFGHISPLKIALAVKEKADSPNTKAFLEELIVRRELAYNFTTFSATYMEFSSLPPWAQDTLNEHQNDDKPYLYSYEEFEKAQTHDAIWNAAQNEMVLTGKMHGYLRMYWGKMILQWHESAATAFATAVKLNDRYELDGSSPNSYAGVAWCFGKHDRPWPTHKIFGKVRMMSANGIKRKYDVAEYIDKVKKLSPSAD